MNHFPCSERKGWADGLLCRWGAHLIVPVPEEGRVQTLGHFRRELVAVEVQAAIALERCRVPGTPPNQIFRSS